MSALARVLGRLAEGGTLERAEMREAMDVVMRGEATDAQIGAMLMALRVRGETPEEIAGAAESMRAHAVTIAPDRHPVLDTCGTGGDGAGTFNISTAAAFVAAAGGVAVAKHGNRSVSSNCGSADVLEALGARIDLPPEDTRACLETTGVGFLFAPHHHRAARHAVGPRKELGVRTLFNLVGPLCNPGGATHQVMGVPRPELTPVMAKVLSMLGSEGAMVVHGAGGLDEFSIEGPTRVSEWRNGSLRDFEVTPEEAGVRTAPLSEVRGGDAPENAALIRGLLTDREGPAREIVVLNAGAAFWVTGTDPTLAAGVERAREAIAGGDAARTLEAFITFTREHGA